MEVETLVVEIFDIVLGQNSAAKQVTVIDFLYEN